MRSLAHRGELDPVVHVRAEGVGVPVVHLAEEVPQIVRVGERLEDAVHRPERRVHPGFGGLDLLAFQEGQVAVHGFVEPPVELLGGSDPFELGQRPVPVLLEPERRMRTGQLAPDQGDHLFPRPGHQVDALHEPGVAVGPDSGRAGLPVRLGFEEGVEVLGRLPRGAHRRIEIGARPGDPLPEGEQVVRLVPERPEPGEPEIPRVRGGEVPLRLFEERRDRPDPRGEFGGRGGRERVSPGPEVDPAVDHRALVGRDIALGGKDRHIERRVSRPRAPHPVVEVEPVHLGPHQVPVHLVPDAPAVRRERLEPGAPGGKFRELASHRRGGVVGYPVLERRALELAPLGEERDQVGVGSRRRRRRLGRAPEREQQEEGKRSRRWHRRSSSAEDRTRLTACG